MRCEHGSRLIREARLRWSDVEVSSVRSEEGSWVDNGKILVIGVGPPDDYLGMILVSVWRLTGIEPGKRIETASRRP